MSKRTGFLLLSGILAAAAALRFLALDSIPPGWHHDEALMGVMASEAYHGLQRPVFFAGYLGQEPLYIYMVAGMMAVLGGSQDILTVRLVSAILGLATVLVAYFAGREMFGRRAGLLSAAMLATSFWHVMYSRNGFRVISQPLLEGLAVYFFWRARRTGSPWLYAASGATFAATTYTYLSGRTFPAVLVAFGVWSLVFHGRPSRAALGRLALLAGAAILTAAPIYQYWLSHPGTFSGRMEQVFVFSPGVNNGRPLLYLADAVSRTLQMFAIHGEEMLRYNMSGRPVFVWALAPLFYTGLAIVLWRACKKDAPSVFLMIWMAVMLGPSMLSWDEGGYTLRNLAVIPGLYLFPAVGAVALWDFTRAQLRLHLANSWVRLAPPVALSIVIAIDGALTYRDYFLDWSRQFGTAYQTDAEFVAEARFLASSSRPEDEQVFAGSAYLGHPVVSQLAPDVYRKLGWIDGSNTVVYRRSAAKDSLYVLTLSTLPSGIDRYFPPENLIAEQRFASGVGSNEPPPLFLAYRLTHSEVDVQVERWLGSPTVPADASFGGTVKLLGSRIPGSVVESQPLDVYAIWSPLRANVAQDYVLFAHLVDDHGQKWAGSDLAGYPPSQWTRDDVVVTHFPIAVPRNVEPGKYHVEFGMYNRGNGKRLPLDSSPSNAVALGTVKLVPSQAPSPQDFAARLDRQLGDAITLVAYDTSLEGAGNARALHVRLLWNALSKPKQDYTVFVQLLGPDGKLVAQSDAMPGGNRFPTGIWDQGDLVVDRHEMLVDPKLAAGSYRLIAGMYLLSTGQRLQVPAGGDYVPLGEVNLR